MNRPVFVSNVAAAKGEVTLEQLLDELVERFAERSDYNLTPRAVETVLYELVSDVRTARERAAKQAEQPQ